MIRIILLLSCCYFLGCKPLEVPPPIPEPTPTASLSLKLQHYWNTEANTFYPETWYVLPGSDDSILFNKLRYYLSGFYLLDSNGLSTPLPPSYRLVAVNGGVFSIALSGIPHGHYTGIGFYLGIDAARNFAGTFEGELHPDYGMYRNAQEGFNFLWAAGLSRSAPNDSFEYRLYGSDPLHPVYRNIELGFAQERLHIDGDHTAEVGIYVNTARFWAAGAGPSHRHSILQPGADAAAMAQRFSTAFSFEHIHQ